MTLTGCRFISYSFKPEVHCHKALDASSEARPAVRAHRLAYLSILYILFNIGTITSSEVFCSAVIVSPLMWATWLKSCFYEGDLET